MIINVRGTNGSGKSWVMRQLMETYDFKGELWKYQLGARPDTNAVSLAGYWLQGRAEGTFLLGNYSKPTGGCDAFKDLKVVEELLEFYMNKAKHVLFEGFFVSNAHTQWLTLASAYDNIDTWKILFLNTDLDKCYANINKRRADRGNEPRSANANTEDGWRRMARQHPKFRNAGFSVYEQLAEEAVRTISGWIES